MHLHIRMLGLAERKSLKMSRTSFSPVIGDSAHELPNACKGDCLKLGRSSLQRNRIALASSLGCQLHCPAMQFKTCREVNHERLKMPQRAESAFLGSARLQSGHGESISISSGCMSGLSSVSTMAGASLSSLSEGETGRGTGTSDGKVA